MKNHKIRHKQHGVGLISFALALLGATIFLLGIAQYLQALKYENLTNITAKRFEHLQNAAQRHYMDSIQSGAATTKSIKAYPADVKELINDGYIEKCTASNEQAGLCIDQSKLPWVDSSNVDMKMSVNPVIDPSDSYPAFDISFDIGNVQPIKFRNLIRSKMIQFANYSERNNVITIRTTRPGTALAYDAFVLKDGSKKMDDNWDFGAVYLDNVKDMSFSGVNDRTALTGSIKIGSKYIRGSAGEYVPKPTCPSGYESKIEVLVKAISGKSSALPNNLKAVAAWWSHGNSSNWKVHYRATGEDGAGNKRYFYEGSVTYFTWCDFK